MNARQVKPSGCLGGCLIPFGLAVAALFLLALVGTQVDDKPEPAFFIPVLLVFVAGGVGVALLGWAQIKTTRRLKGYIDLIENQGHRRIDRMAQLMDAKDVRQAMRDVQTILNRRYLPGYRLDPTRGVVEPFDPAAPPLEEARPWLVRWTCPACGAANQVQTLDGRVACEFCGTKYTGPSQNQG